MKKLYIYLSLLFLSLLIVFIILKKKNMTSISKSTIVILNGPSASGKSSIQKELQKIMYEPYLAIGIDNFFCKIMPEHYMGGKPTEFNMPAETEVIKGEFITDECGYKIFKLSFFKESQKIISGMHHAIAAYANQSNNIIVDYILYDKNWLKEFVKVLKDFNVIFVGINLPIEILEEREKSRGTSPVGHARSHYKTVHDQIPYDLEFDTSKLTAKECALKIKEFIVSKQQPKAFEKLRKVLN